MDWHFPLKAAVISLYPKKFPKKFSKVNQISCWKHLMSFDESKVKSPQIFVSFMFI